MLRKRNGEDKNWITFQNEKEPPVPLDNILRHGAPWMSTVIFAVHSFFKAE
jgi:hypothetical protein